MNKLNKVVITLSKIGEILLMICDVVLLVFTIIACFTKTTTIASAINSGKLPITNINITSNTQHVKVVLILTFVLGLIVLINSTMIFRNINLIFKTTQGKTWFSKGKTPFQNDNVRMIREIAIFMIVIVVMEFVGGHIINLVASATVFNIRIDFGKIFYSLIVLCLSQYFAYGVSLEEEVEGLV